MLPPAPDKTREITKYQIPSHFDDAMSAIHERYMRHALQLARKGVGRTSPNPAVGAVVVKRGRLVGQGYHRRAGAPHAEADALRQAGRRARGATLYVTLEPCNHTGRTPPCCDAILAAGIRRVVAAAKDPNPVTDGRGLRRLARAGIAVMTGPLAAEARALNAPFFKVMTTGLPLVVAKIAQSLDGKIAAVSGDSRWITAAPARRLVHRWRSQADAVLVGISTVLADDPRLTARGVGTARTDRPVKVIVDSRLRTPPHARCLSRVSPAPTWIATTAGASAGRAKRLTSRGAEILRFASRQGRVPLRQLLRRLADRGIQSVLIEGGGEILAGALRERLVDRLAIFIAPTVIGGRAAPGSVGGEGVKRLLHAVRLEEMSVRWIGGDLLVEGRPVYPLQARR